MAEVGGLLVSGLRYGEVGSGRAAIAANPVRRSFGSRRLGPDLLPPEAVLRVSFA